MSNNVTISPEDYKSAINEGRDFFIEFQVYNEELETLLHKIVHRYLSRYDIIYYKNVIITISKELINNAIKANIKRLFFKIKNLDITKSSDYRVGMETFKDEAYSSNETIIEKLSTTNLKVRMSFRITANQLQITVINNMPILEEEIAKVKARQKKAYRYNDISEAFNDVLDDSEGAGLGLIMALMLLKNAGFSQDAFAITTNGKITAATVSIPLKQNNASVSHKIADEILKELDSLPSFPENIQKIQLLCNNPDSSIKEIAYNIKKDPGLTTSILKLANSAGYITSKKIDSIDEAVKIIGMQGIQTLLIASGVKKIIDSKYKKFESTWKNSFKKGFYAQRLSIINNHPEVTDNAYLAALLSEIGYMILLSIKPDLILRLKDLAGSRGMLNTDLLEEISLGISHNALGASICERWSFDPAVVKSIEYYQRPQLAPPEYQDLISQVYLANVMTEIEAKKIRFELIEEEVLNRYNLNNKEEFDRIHQELKKGYLELDQTLLG